MNNKIALESLAMDLKRVALGYHRGSTAMAERFYKEAQERIAEINPLEVKTYMQNILREVKNLGPSASEEALLYSTLIQNYARTFYQ